MFKNLIWMTLLAALLLGIATSNTAPTEPDPVLESFERELNHEPAPTARVKRDEIDNDELYELVNAVHWTQDGISPGSIEPLARGGNDNEDDSNE